MALSTEAQMAKIRDEMDEWSARILLSLASGVKPEIMARSYAHVRTVQDGDRYKWMEDYLDPINYELHEHRLSATKHNLLTNTKTVTLKKPFTGISASEANEHMKSFPPVPFYPDKCDCELCRDH